VACLSEAIPAPVRFSVAAARQARHSAVPVASAQQAAALPSGEPEEPGVSDAAAELPAARDAAEAPQRGAEASGATEVPQPVAVWAGAVVPHGEAAVRVAVVRQQEAAPDAVRLRAVPGVRAAVPPSAAPLAFRQDRFPALAR
jgi:hypothetical protein